MEHFTGTSGDFPEIIEKNKEYKKALDGFFTQHGFVQTATSPDGNPVFHVDTTTESLPETLFTREHLDGLEAPSFLRDYFSQRGYPYVAPKSIVNTKGTTLFTSAAVQVFDRIIHEEIEYTPQKMFVAQPVFRTQFIDAVTEGVSTSFINIATEMIGATPRDHFAAISEWLKLLQSLGFNLKNFSIEALEKPATWGKKEILQKIVRISHQGLDIGDALFLEIPQESRNPVVVSDVGFGYDRIKWQLFSELAYFQSALPPDRRKHSVPNKIFDYTRTLALLIGSGVKPGNKDQGYRVRLLSKLLTQCNLREKADVEELAGWWYDDWLKWTDLPTDRDVVMRILHTENERNFNRELLNNLKEFYQDVDVNVNQSTAQVLKALRGTSVDGKVLHNILKKLGHEI